MPQTKPSEWTRTDMDNALSDFSIDTSNTSPQSHICDWKKWYGYYKNINAVSSIIDKKALWTIGRGFKADNKTKKILDNIKGNGKDTFNSILHNAVRVGTIGGDFVAEKIFSKTTPTKLVNLKPLNPGSIKIIANSKGIIKEYRQITETNPANPSKEKYMSFKPDDIFHLSFNRTADDIHGIGMIEKLESEIKAFQQGMDNLKIIFNRYVKPLWVFSVDTDDPTEIADFKSKVDNTVDKSENLIVPKDTVDKIDRVSIPPNSTLDPLPWIKWLEQQFLKAEGIPDIILGQSTGGSESESKILYLAWQQVIEWNQLYLREQIKNQLNLNIELEFPASIEPDLITDNQKDSLNRMKPTSADKRE